jgi:hypothetical protein
MDACVCVKQREKMPLGVFVISAGMVAKFTARILAGCKWHAQ